jgi:uncharacterized membrane protein YsdA (DUF1294 family)
MHLLLIGFIIVMSIFAFILMRMDKNKAIRRKHRISEKTLWIVAIFGGGIGAYFGMMMFRHKTKHLNFRIGFTLLAVAHITFVIWAYPYLRDLEL